MTVEYDREKDKIVVKKEQPSEDTELYARQFARELQEKAIHEHKVKLNRIYDEYEGELDY